MSNVPLLDTSDRIDDESEKDNNAYSRDTKSYIRFVRIIEKFSVIVSFIILNLPYLILTKTIVKPIGLVLSYSIVSLNHFYASYTVPSICQIIQLIITIVNFVIGVSYMIAPIVNKYKYFGLVHIIYLSVNTPLCLVLLTLEPTLNNLMWYDGTNRLIMTYDHLIIENVRIVSEMYGSIIISMLLTLTLQITDLVKHGIIIPSIQTASYNVYFMFVCIALSVSCFTITYYLLINCTFRRRTRPIIKESGKIKLKIKQK